MIYLLECTSDQFTIGITEMRIMKITDKFMRSQLELTKPITNASSIESLRNLQDKLGKLMHFTKRRDVVAMDKSNDKHRAQLIIPRDELRGGLILYLHGGGYVCGSHEYAKGFASVLSAECGMKVITVDYRLAPEDPFPAALDDVYEIYCELLERGLEPEKTIIAGESAGGGLAYSLCLKLKDNGKPLPAGIIAISPWCDLTLSGDSYAKNKDSDPTLTKERLTFFADCYVGQYSKDEATKIKRLPTERRADIKKLRDPYVSPLFAELEGMPPSLIFAGEDELILSDAVDMRDKLFASGCDVTLITRANMWHAYLLYGLKSNAKDYDLINDFVKKCLPKDNERKLRWMHLDNSAKIYPAAATSRWNNIYRLSATLKEDVDREVLQSSLDVTVRRFPSIAVKLKRGVFWYYLQEIEHAPTVQDEKSYPLVRMPLDDIRNCAFRVLIYKKRIAVEFFHALTDGNGALVFLKTLVAEYLTQKYGVSIPNEHGVLNRLESPRDEELRDDFPKNKAPVGKSRQESNSYRIYGEKEDDGFCHVTTFMLSSGELLEQSRKLGVTVTALTAAIFIKASINLQREDVKKLKHMKKVKVLIPVNLRKIYNSKTLRNFALYVTPGVDPRLGEYTIEELAKIVHHRMALDITEKNMSARIYTNVKDEERLALKLTPLFLKNIVMRAIFLLVGEKKSTLSISNLGLIKLPAPMDEYVDRLDFVLSVQSNAPYNAGMLSYGDKLNLSIIRNIKEPRLERAIYEEFKALGIHVKVESNDR